MWNNPVFPSDRTLTVPFRLQLVILTHRRSRAVSEESSHWKGRAVVLVGKLFSLQAPQSFRKTRVGGLAGPIIAGNPPTITAAAQ